MFMTLQNFKNIISYKNFAKIKFTIWQICLDYGQNIETINTIMFKLNIL